MNSSSRRLDLLRMLTTSMPREDSDAKKVVQFWSLFTSASSEPSSVSASA